MATTVPQLLEDARNLRKGAVAVTCGSTSMTHGELMAQSNRIANTLKAVGVKRGDRVGVYLDKSIGALAGLIGIMKADAVCVPLDPTGPVARMGFIVADCGVRVLITSGNKQRRLEAFLADGGSFDTILVLGDKPLELAGKSISIVSSVQIAQASGAVAPFQALETDLAYILYTSGSTGRPKGVMITHRNIVAFADWAAGHFGVGPADRVASHAPFHFDISLFDLYVALSRGATVCLVPQGIGFLGVDLVQFIAENRITIWQSVPSVLMIIEKHIKERQMDLGALRVVFFAGEPYPPQALRNLMKKLPGARYFNIYGATETNDVTCHAIERLPDDAPLPIGRSCSHMEVLVLDEHDRPLSETGSIGELCARGPTVARGYWGDPHMTAEKFVQNPLHSDFADPLYRSGDLVEIRRGGVLAYVGRRDAQVKIRGYRINLREVEDAISSHPDVAEAAVIDRIDADGTRFLAAVVATSGGAEITLRALKRHVTNSLPNYMAPETLEIVPALPKTSTGKLDRQALKREVKRERVAGAAAS
ncbi:amino acid adenylation domain-containing protein [Stappia sp. ES.058]|uniref:amino acid adenylation domain-containing protein n=1 Tax=Stappia sp. ES.058 TaxID=1881061 RepID=UPI0008798B47|nr:amino acid adenylation domain-containing protein [Stappia sp. ES.058]SDU03567.1 amino acid adenylation domain-containing protein [Stappia sp. ES.058]